MKVKPVLNRTIHSFGEVGMYLLSAFETVNVSSVFGDLQFGSRQVKDLTGDGSDNLLFTQSQTTVRTALKFQFMALVGIVHLFECFALMAWLPSGVILAFLSQTLWRGFV